VLKPLQEHDPGRVRKTLQPRYDAYMRRDRATLGVVIPDITLATMGANQEEREEAYDQLASRWPRKSAVLITAIAKEMLFHEASKTNHLTHVTNLTRHLEGKGESGFAYLSGLGRNACMLSLVEVTDAKPVIGRGTFSTGTALSIVGHLDGKLLPFIDPDFGLGDLSVQTPEVFGIDIDSPALMLKSMELFKAS
jgi:hypothetical protein